jgi:predicted nucleic acid-binding OB-fold protein
MSRMPFSYADFEDARARLLPEIKKVLKEEDKRFLLDFAKAEPIWGDFDFSAFPSIQWKLQNLEKFKKQSPKPFQDQVAMLNEVLGNL